ncbi:response regulator transcription factor [Mucilaginibacter sp. BJC16-A38]|uniref:response regulator transcription factor n=1 Tax=Mucilaginibacter phenanthrenivorans TaxID=1234842 RepID=UPI0021583281|nr:response regulator transcription factor [Mucilaginibacter phenanthrenivorans]MCR8557899.1 response regulator transcription factor [Mucilaginibacter phenanthrenivorans]
MKQAKVLLLEDELQLAKIVSETLRSRGFAVTHVNNGVLGLDAARKNDFDVYIVDVMMPFLDGFTFVEELRKTDKQAPVLFLTAKSQTEDVIKGYATGGNDYLKKPFSLEELILRLNELLRRNAAIQSAVSEIIGQYTFYQTRQELWFNGQLSGKLSHRENELLSLLLQNKNQVLDRKAVLLKLWGDDNFFNTRTMDVFITKLRKHLKEDPSVEIINMRGVGYKLIF